MNGDQDVEQQSPNIAHVFRLLVLESTVYSCRQYLMDIDHCYTAFAVDVRTEGAGCTRAPPKML